MTYDICENWYKIFLTRNEFEGFDNLENILGVSKVFGETTWNWTVFWFHVNCELIMFLPLGYDMWLFGDYPARYYSLCDIGILAPVFVMAMSSGFVSVMSSGFVSAD